MDYSQLELFLVCLVWSILAFQRDGTYSFLLSTYWPLSAVYQTNNRATNKTELRVPDHQQYTVGGHFFV